MFRFFFELYGHLVFIKNYCRFLFFRNKNNIYNLDVFRDSAFFLNHQMPRVTGL